MDRGSGFFGWLRGIGVIRENGWLGGVCGGIAARIGIDPIIVRGIVVVVALLGGPAFLFYAAAWVLLPDSRDRIHLERMLRGIFDPPAIAIIVMAALTFLPIAQGVWWAGGTFWYWGGVPGSIFKAIWSLVVVAAIVVFIVWAARGFPGSRWQRYGASWGTPPSAGAGTGTAGSAGSPASGSGTGGGGTAESSAAAGSTDAGTIAGSAPAAGSQQAGSTGAGDGATSLTGSSDLADWQRRQAAWRAERDAWRAQQAADQGAARQRRAAEYQKASAQAAAREEARRMDRLANPHASARFVWGAIGFALVAGAVFGTFASANAAIGPFAPAVGLAAATAVFGIASIVAALMRRRAGFLGFLGLVLLVATLAAAFAPDTWETAPWAHVMGVSWIQHSMTTVQTTVKEIL